MVADLTHYREHIDANLDYGRASSHVCTQYNGESVHVYPKTRQGRREDTCEILSKDGRISWRDLSDQIGLSLTPTLRTPPAPESDGIITGYSAQFDEQKLGYGITMYVWVSLERQVEETLKVFERRIADVPEVMSCYLMTGEADYVLRIVVPDLPSYQRFMLDVLTRIPGVSRIQSGLAIKPVFHRAAPPIPR